MAVTDRDELWEVQCQCIYGRDQPCAQYLSVRGEIGGRRHRRARWTFHSGQRRRHAHELRPCRRHTGEARDRLWRGGSRPPISSTHGPSPLHAQNRKLKSGRAPRASSTTPPDAASGAVRTTRTNYPYVSSEHSYRWMGHIWRSHARLGSNLRSCHLEERAHVRVGGRAQRLGELRRVHAEVKEPPPHLGRPCRALLRCDAC